MKYIIKKGEKR